MENLKDIGEALLSWDILAVARCTRYLNGNLLVSMKLIYRKFLASSSSIVQMWPSS